MNDFLKNKVLESARIKDNKFEDLGSLGEFCKKYGDSIINVENFNEQNICLIIHSKEDILFKLLCSQTLSRIIKETKKLPENITDYRILRITRDDNSKYIRVSQSIEIEINEDSNFDELAKNIKGNVNFIVKAENFKNGFKKQRLYNPEDLIDL